MAKLKPPRPAPRSHPTSEYSLKLKNPKWQQIRLKVFERAGWKCEACGDETDSLVVHHGFYRYGLEPWELPAETLWCLCETCHNTYQACLPSIKFELGLVNPLHYVDILWELTKAREKRPAMSGDL